MTRIQVRFTMDVDLPSLNVEADDLTFEGTKESMAQGLIEVIEEQVCMSTTIDPECLDRLWAAVLEAKAKETTK